MPLTIELLPDPAANDLRLTQLVAERDFPLRRLNILHGSALQRLATQRMLAEANGGALAAIYGFTPVDLAAAASRLGDRPDRQTWPAGADIAAVQQVARSVPIRDLDPSAPGIPSALLRTLTDLREAALAPADLPEGDLRNIFTAWTDHVATVADRTSNYEDAIAPTTPTRALGEALGNAPLIVSGIYDLTRIQRLLLARLAQSTDVRMLLVTPSNDPDSLSNHTLDTLRRELNVRVIRSRLSPEPLAPDHYFSVGDPTAEADAIASRILQLGRDGVAFHDIAIFHQQGTSADERICAALERAEIPSWRIGGRQLADTPIGQAASTLVSILLNPESVERTTLLDWMSHRALRDRPLGVTRRPAQWERIALDAGLARGLHQMRQRLDGWLELDRSEEASDLAQIIRDLCQRSRQLEKSGTWSNASDELLEAFEAYLEDNESADDHRELVTALKDSVARIREHDAIDTPWSPSVGLTAIGRALRSRVVRDPKRLIGGVNVGAATGPARGIRYHAIFVAGVAERVFPAVGRQDPLLPDPDRAEINARIPDALALQGERALSDRHAWFLARRSARWQFSASWSRRSSAVGGPSRPSTLILESASPDPEGPILPETTLTKIGSIERIDSSVVTPSLRAADVADDNWSAALDTPELRSFGLALIAAPGADSRPFLPRIWPIAESAELGRLRRNASRFTNYDGFLTDSVPTESWWPLDHVWTATALETYVHCPYRFYLQYIVGAESSLESDRPDRSQRRIHGDLVRRVLAAWAQKFDRNNPENAWLDYADEPSNMASVARDILDAAQDAGALGPPAGTHQLRTEIERDLDRCRRREVIVAREGWRPVEVNFAFHDATLKVTGHRTLRLRGAIDRIDRHPSGHHRAIRFFTDEAIPDVRGFVNGSSFESIVALAGLNQYGINVGQAEVQHCAVTRRGHFESQLLRGESLTSNSRAAAARLRDTLALIADQLEAANFVPYPGRPARDRPHCQRCPYESACTTDIGQRYEHKARQHQDAIRQIEQLRQQRP